MLPSYMPGFGDSGRFDFPVTEYFCSPSQTNRDSGHSIGEWNKDEEIRILYVDDEENNLFAFKAAFRRYFMVYTTVSADEAKIILAKNEIHVLITDQRMPGTLGTELLAEVVKEYPDQIRILLTAWYR